MRYCTILAFTFAKISSFSSWIVATIIFNAAEVILVPSLNIKIDQMAPNHLRGSYFSASFSYRIGFGAYIGGVLLQSVGVKGLFVTMFFLSIITAALYSLSKRLKRPEFIHS